MITTRTKEFRNLITNNEELPNDLSMSNLQKLNFRERNMIGFNLSKTNLTEANLSRVNLTGANLTGANLTRADLTGANLTNADLSDSILTGANLTNADLIGANLIGADLSDANLSDADLSDADLSVSILIGANLTNADLSDAYLSEADLSDADLTGANLSEANLSEANLSKVNLTGANLSDADLSDADLTNADLSNANLSEANLTRADLTGANLTGANLTLANLTRADLIGANLTNADLSDANLNDADLSDADLSDSILIGANLTNTDLSDANLSDADLSDADLTGANLTGANLTQTNLTRADLIGANLINADLSDANLNDANLSDADLIDSIFIGANLAGAILTGVHGANFTGAIGLGQSPPRVRVNPYEIHEKIVILINRLPKIFQLMNPTNETQPDLNTSSLVTDKINHLTTFEPTSVYDLDFINNLKNKIATLNQIIMNANTLISTAKIGETYRDYTRDIEPSVVNMPLNKIISNSLHFMNKLTVDTKLYYLDEWATGSLTAYEAKPNESGVSCTKGIIERLLISVAPSLRIYFDENTQSNPELISNYAELISLISNVTFNTNPNAIEYLDATEFTNNIVSKCFQEWYGEHSYADLQEDNITEAISEFKECVKQKYETNEKKLPESLNYDGLVDEFIEQTLKKTMGGSKKKFTKKKFTKKKSTKKKSTKKKKNTKRTKKMRK